MDLLRLSTLGLSLGVRGSPCLCLGAAISPDSGGWGTCTLASSSAPCLGAAGAAPDAPAVCALLRRPGWCPARGSGRGCCMSWFCHHFLCTCGHFPVPLSPFRANAKLDLPVPPSVREPPVPLCPGERFGMHHTLHRFRASHHPPRRHSDPVSVSLSKD